MRAGLSLVGLIVVLAIVGLSLRSQLHAVQHLAPSGAAAGPDGGASGPDTPAAITAQYKATRDRALKDASAQAASAGASAEADAGR